jgi:hypothetical protein
MSTTIKRVFFLILSVVLLAGCATVKASTQAPSPTPVTIQVDDQYAPQAGDDTLASDTVEFVSAEAANLGGSPAQVQLSISYRLPTPCHQTRVIVNPPDSENRIYVKMYSLFKANTPCALMPLSTPLQAVLTLGSLPAGHFTLFVNDAKATEFDY